MNDTTLHTEAAVSPSCVCPHPHTIATAPRDWFSGALTFRNAEGYWLHGQPCSYSDEIAARWTNAQLHDEAQRYVEEVL